MRLPSSLLVVGLGLGSLTTASPASAHSTSEQIGVEAVAGLDACPVFGPSQFVDSWGDARSAGRRHEGVDMSAPGGTPVVAVRDGAAEFKRSNLGGNAIWLTTSSGERFYYAHLEAWEGESRSVNAGEIIGYVGQTGNAQGDHLHFETRMGDVAVNPFPSVRSTCLTDAAMEPLSTSIRSLLR